NMDYKEILIRLFNLKIDKNESTDSIEEVGGEMTGDTGFLSFRRRLKIKKGDSMKRVFLKFNDTSRTDLGDLKQLSEVANARECLFYGTFAPLLERTASQLGLGSVGLPTVHLEMVLPTGTLIVMEDLGEAGFELAPATMNVAEARCVLSSLARVQAAFLLTKARLGSPASGLFGPQSPLSDGFKSTDVAGFDFAEMLPGCFEAFVREFPKYLKCEKRVAAINSYLNDDFVAKAQRYLKTNVTEKEGIGVTHCDLWYNNCMLSRDSSGHPVACRIIDWQVFGIGSLAHDFGLLWLSSIDNSIVIEQFFPFVKYYYDTIRRFFGDSNAQVDEFPVSLERMKQLAVASVLDAIIMTVVSVEILPAIAKPDNWLANMADLIQCFKL
ncbi:hypothetical protein BOX15_Mlig009006g2, partial [Macrostomum lignano]